MAKRVRKTYKERQRDLEAPEIVEETLWSLSDWMEQNWRPIAMGVGTLIVLWGGIGVFQMISASSKSSGAENSAAVFSALNKPIYVKPATVEGEDPNKPLGETFESEKLRAAAVLAASSGAEGDGSVMVGVLQGAAKAANGDTAGQVAMIDAALKEAGDSALVLPLHEQRASALSATGKTAEAVVSWKQVATGAKTTFAKAHALIRIADLHNTRAGAKTANDGVAKTNYKAALDALKVKGKAPEKGPLAFLHAEASAKLASL